MALFEELANPFILILLAEPHLTLVYYLIFGSSARHKRVKNRLIVDVSRILVGVPD